MMKLYKYTYYIKRLITFCFLTTFLLNGFLASAQNLKDLEIANDYFFRKEYNKAKLVYEKLLKKNSKQQDIHSYYLKCLMELGEFKKAKRYLGKQVRNFPEQTLYKIDYGKILGKLKGEEAQKAYYAEYIESEKNKRRLFAMGQFLKDMKMYPLTEKALLRSMSFSIDTYFELADLYALWGKDELMIKTLFGILNVAPVKLQQVQNFISNHITTNQQKQLFQKQIVRKIQKSPRAYLYNELLLWFLVQQKKFSTAFLQARALEKRRNTGGRRLVDLAAITEQNKDYKTAIKIYDYVVKNYETEFNRQAKIKLITIQEKMTIEALPKSKGDLKKVSDAYYKFFQEEGIDGYSFGTVIRFAKLKAFYINDLDTAVVILDDLLKNNRIPATVQAEAKMTLGDIYMLKDEFWESILLYGQVAKENGSSAVSYAANLKKAKLHYYKGDFEVARSVLDILKIATSKEIANDAIQLSSLISDNLDLDTTQVVMQKFARIDFLVFQSKYEEAIKDYQKMLDDYPGHSLEDEILWNIGNLQKRIGNYAAAVESFEEILKNHNLDILGDDASFAICTLYQDKLKNREKALEAINRHLKMYTDSVFNEEIRRRFRQLRDGNI